MGSKNENNFISKNHEKIQQQQNKFIETNFSVPKIRERMDRTNNNKTKKSFKIVFFTIFISF